jgi:hypothetical protein
MTGEGRLVMATTTLEKGTDVRQYCETVYRELSEMKKRIFDIICGVETSTAEEDTRRGEYFDLFDLVDYIEKKLEALTRECPPDWRSVKEEIERGKRQLGNAINWWFG